VTTYYAAVRVDLHSPDLWPSELKIDTSVTTVLLTKVFQLRLNNVATLPCKNVKAELSSTRASSTRPLISGGQGWGHVFMPVESTLSNWIIEITVCLLNGSVFTRTLFRTKIEFKGKHSHCSISTCQKQLFLQGVWRRYFVECGKFYFASILSKTLHINFYQNRSSIVVVTTKTFGCFYALQCSSSSQILLRGLKNEWLGARTDRRTNKPQRGLLGRPHRRYY